MKVGFLNKKGDQTSHSEVQQFLSKAMVLYVYLEEFRAFVIEFLKLKY